MSSIQVKALTAVGSPSVGIAKSITWRSSSSLTPSETARRTCECTAPSDEQPIASASLIRRRVFTSSGLPSAAASPRCSYAIPYLRMTVGHVSCSGRKISLHFALACNAAAWHCSITIGDQEGHRLQVRPTTSPPIACSLFLAVCAELLEIGPEGLCLGFVLDAREYHLGPRNLCAGILDVFQERCLVPGDA